MSRLANLNTIRHSIFHHWQSIWFDTIYFSKFVTLELATKNYLLGLFFRLKIPTDYFILECNLNSQIFIYTNLYFYKKFKYYKLLFIQDHLFSEYLLKKQFFLDQYIHSSYYYNLLSSNLNPKIKNIKCSNTNYIVQLIGWFVKYKKFFIKNPLDLIFPNNNFYFVYTYLFQQKKIEFPVRKFNFFLLNSIGYKFNEFLDYYFLYYFLNFLSLKHKYKRIYNLLYRNFFHFFIVLNKKNYILNIDTNNFNNINTFSIFNHFHKYTLQKTRYLNSKLSNFKYLNTEIFTKKLKSNYYYYYFKYYINHFFYRIQVTLSYYFKTNVFFIPKYNLPPLKKKMHFFPIISSKIIVDFMKLELYTNKKIFKVFKLIRTWHWYNYKKRIILDNKSLYNINKKLYLYSLYKEISFKKYPCLGIKIECSGTSKKGRRKKKIFYGNYLKNIRIIKKNPHNSFSADIDYYQSFYITNSCTIGIKCWVFFKTHIYNNHKKFISFLGL